MAITAPNVSYSGTGPTATGQVIADRGDAGNFAQNLVGTFTVVLDGALTTFVMNYIDGSAVLGFKPSTILWSKNGGTESTAAVVKIVDNGDGIGATVTLSAAGTNANTLKYGVALYR
jgi:hypothetical protein